MQSSLKKGGKSLIGLMKIVCLLLPGLTLIISCNNGNTSTAAAFSRTLWVDSFPKPQGYINDYGDIYTPEQEAFLESIAASIELKTTAQVAVVSFDSATVAGADFDSLTLKLANYWGIGQRETNNGMFIGIAPVERRIRIQYGKGMEKIFPDEATKRLIDTVILPSFRNGNYLQGTEKGLNTILKTLEAWNE